MTSPPPIITLLTDFGQNDEYVGVMKGVILSRAPQARIIDITHHIPPHNIAQAALVLKNAYTFFPPGSIHVAVVDPGVGGKRPILCLRQGSYTFVAPDNGILTRVVQDAAPGDLYSVTNRTFFRETISPTFHGRDIFAPVAAHLATGTALHALGPRCSLDTMTLLPTPRPQISTHGHLTGEIISIDHFGNLVTNIDRPTFCRNFPALSDKTHGPDIQITVAGMTIDGISTSYENVPVGTPLALFGSRDLLEISVNQGRAESFGQLGQPVSIAPTDPDKGGLPPR